MINDEGRKNYMKADAFVFVQTSEVLSCLSQQDELIIKFIHSKLTGSPSTSMSLSYRGNFWEESHALFYKIGDRTFI